MLGQHTHMHNVHEYWMSQALALAASVMYTTAPNPRVGCLIVNQQTILGQGATQEAGGAHAEICAIRDAQTKRNSLVGSTFYVTLEPCSHFGRTSPCVDAILACQPKEVVVAMRDPNPLVNGKGIQKLRNAGIQVTENVCFDAALAINIGFVSRRVSGLPWLWSKIASSLDGKIALKNGTSTWITEEAARFDAHQWRARSCVVLTGSGTVLADNPLLTVRHIKTARPPIRAIIDSAFRIPENAAIFDGNPVWLFVAKAYKNKVARLAEKNVRVIEIPVKKVKLDLLAVLYWMGQQQINEIHLEAGAGLNGAFMQAGLVSELIYYLAPQIIGQGLAPFLLPQATSLEQTYRYLFFEHISCGCDIRIRARLAKRWDELKQACLS